MILQLLRSSDTLAAQFAFLLLWQTCNASVYVAWAMVGTQRALTAVKSPPLRFSFMLAIDTQTSLVFLTTSLRDPFFWAALLTKILFQVTLHTGVFDDSLAFIVRRLVVSSEFTHSEVLASWEGRVKLEGNLYCNTIKVHAKRALAGGVLETVVDGDVQATQSYLQGDFIVCGAATAHHLFKYHLSSDEFAARFIVGHSEPATDPELAEEGFELYSPTGKVWALQLSASDVALSFSGVASRCCHAAMVLPCCR